MSKLLDRRFTSNDLVPITDASVGETLYVGSYSSFGVVRYVGTTDFSSGKWVGLELPAPTGKNDGSVYGKRYFPCKPAHGVFVRMSACLRVNDNLDDSGEYSPGKTPPVRVGRKNPPDSVSGKDSVIAASKGTFKTPSKSMSDAGAADQESASARLNRPFLSRATRESLLGTSKDVTGRKSIAPGNSRMSMAPSSRTSISASASRTSRGTTPQSKPAGSSPMKKSLSMPNVAKLAENDLASLHENIDSLGYRVLALEDTLKRISDVIVESIQRISRKPENDSELSAEDSSNLKNSLVAIAEIARQAQRAVIDEREKHARELDALKREQQRGL